MPSCVASGGACNRRPQVYISDSRHYGTISASMTNDWQENMAQSSTDVAHTQEVDLTPVPSMATDPASDIECSTIPQEGNQTAAHAASQLPGDRRSVLSPSTLAEGWLQGTQGGRPVYPASSRRQAEEAYDARTYSPQCLADDVRRILDGQDKLQASIQDEFTIWAATDDAETGRVMRSNIEFKMKILKEVLIAKGEMEGPASPAVEPPSAVGTQACMDMHVSASVWFHGLATTMLPSPSEICAGAEQRSELQQKMDEVTGLTQSGRCDMEAIFRAEQLAREQRLSLSLCDGSWLPQPRRSQSPSPERA